MDELRIMLVLILFEVLLLNDKCLKFTMYLMIRRFIALLFYMVMWLIWLLEQIDIENSLVDSDIIYLC